MLKSVFQSLSRKANWRPEVRVREFALFTLVWSRQDFQCHSILTSVHFNCSVMRDRTSRGNVPEDCVDGALPPLLPVKKRVGSQSTQDDVSHLSASSVSPSPGPVSPLSTSPYDHMTPLSQSPTSSSISSALSAASSEDILTDTRTEKSHSQSSSQATTPTHQSLNSLNSSSQSCRLSAYDNFEFPTFSSQDTEQFTDFAKRMQELTSDLTTKGSLLDKFSSTFGRDLLSTPPLQPKSFVEQRTRTVNKTERSQVHSTYDNVFGSSQSIVKVMKTSYIAQAGFLSCSSSTSGSAPLPPGLWDFTVLFRTWSINGQWQ